MSWRSKSGRRFSAVCAATICGAASCERQPMHENGAAGPSPSAEVLRVSDETAAILLTLSPPRGRADPTNRFAGDPAAAHFGQFLFFDTSFSGGNAVSCATCHQPDRAFTDGLPVAEAAGLGSRNTPSVLNAAYFPWLNWDGSADTLWMQAARPFEDAHELDSTRTTVARVIGMDPERRAAYEQIFGPLPPSERFSLLPERATPQADPGSPDRVAWESMSEADQSLVTEIFVNLCKAIAAYQTRLVSRSSPFDQFVNAVATGDLQRWAADGNPGFGETELAGFELFQGRADCIACHAGPFLSDFAFHSVRVAPRSGPPATDPGRFDGLGTLLQSPLNAAGPYSDDPTGQRGTRLGFMTNPGTNWGRFRTPSLRNVAETAPYMHAGQFETLDRVLHHYSTFEGALAPDHHDAQEQLLRPLNLTDAEKAAIIAFLRSLSDVPDDPTLLTPPTSPIYSDAPPGNPAKTGR